jgi:hypothetical protein
VCRNIGAKTAGQFGRKISVEMDLLVSTGKQMSRSNPLPLPKAATVNSAPATLAAAEALLFWMGW